MKKITFILTIITMLWVIFGGIPVTVVNAQEALKYESDLQCI